ncbi:MAG: tetratricopeptide repeat protein [Thermoanaerobaculia bacterium]|nr:tetratricopeptide repeat protein [Thermoanaerobaculia bacterium]
MSTPQTTAQPRPSLWILGPGWDLLLFVATPLLILPGMWIARERWSVEEIALFVASFGALGHHLPGMIRAYGDRALFQRFKARFLLAPVFLAAICVAFTVYDLSAILLAVYIWGVWHGMMQTYGFVRIYDAKVKSFAPTTSRLDWWMCLSWFGGAVLLSETRLANVLQTYYQAGGPLIPGSVVQAMRWLGLAVVATVTIVFIVHTIRLWRQGTPPSPIKLLLMATSFGFWWYSNVLVANLLVGIALFEIFHDVQYLSIVFLYNEKRAGSAGDQLTRFARFLFRRSGSLIGLYVGLVFAYGSLNYLSVGLAEAQTLQRTLMGLLLASTLLHFYYDGFIWKVREKSTRSSLGLEGGTSYQAPGWVVHGARWALFAAPVLSLGAIEVGGSAVPPLQRAQAVADAVPSYAVARYDLGVLLAEAGDIETAAEEYRKAIQADPAHADAHYNLGNLAFDAGRFEEAIEHFQASLRIKPDSASALGNLGNALLSSGRREEAVDLLQTANQAHPTDATLRGILGNALSSMGKVEAAVEHYQAAVEIDPELAPARYNLANATMALGRLDEAIAEYLAAVRIDPEFTDARFNLGNALAQLGRHEEAIEHFQAAVLLEAVPETLFNLGNSLLALERFDEAESAFRRAVQATPDFAPAVHNLGVVLHARGDLEGALSQFQESVRIDPAYADAHHNLGVLLMQLGREAEGRVHLEAARRLSGS